MRQLFRADPALPVTAVKSYAIRSPISTHTRAATCAEVECSGHVNGWVTTVDERTELGAKQAYYIRHDSGRGFSEERTEKGWTAFTFPPGQRCFRTGTHRVSLERPALYVVRGGDWRANTGLIRQHVGPDDWVDDFGTHQDRIKTQIERG